MPGNCDKMQDCFRFHKEDPFLSPAVLKPGRFALISLLYLIVILSGEKARETNLEKTGKIFLIF